MITIVRGRDSGKARELITIARDNKAVIVTDNVKKLRDKANRYGIYDVDIKDYYDMISLDPEINTRPIMIHNVDKFLEYYFKISGQNIIGFSATVENITKSKNITHFTCPDCGKEWDEEMPDDWVGLGTKSTLCEDCGIKEIKRFMGK